MQALLLALALGTGQYVPPCVPSGQGYLPTPSPCHVVIVDPRTGEPEQLVTRQLVEGKRPMKLGGRHSHKAGQPPRAGNDRLCAFHGNPRPWWLWLLLVVLL